MKFPSPLIRLSLPLVLVLLVSVSFLESNFVGARPAPYNLTQEQIADFRRDGVIIVRGLLEGDMLEDAVNAVQKIQRSTSWAQRIFYKIHPVYKNLGFQAYRSSKALQRVAFDSAAPTICAKLMGLDAAEPQRSLRLLKDAVLGYSKGDAGCGWHVDDKVFWPCEDAHNDNNTNPVGDYNENGARDTGINVWISLSPLKASEGGGLAVAPGSHDITGKGEMGRLALKARTAIAAKTGGIPPTCFMEKLAPDCHASMEELQRVYDMEPGDAIIHDRYIFHRTIPFVEDGPEDSVTKQRISLRYMPSDATFFNTGIDGAASHKQLQTGDPLYKAGEYFPQAWPDRLEEEASKRAKRDVNIFGSKRLFDFFKKQLVTALIKK